MSYNYPPRLVSLFTTTLSNSIGSGTSDVITLESTARLEQESLVTLTIDRVDANGDATLESREVIQGIVSGNTITGIVRGYDGTTPQTHDAGAVVEVILTAADWNKMVDTLGALDSLITNEIPEGAVDGQNTTFTISQTPATNGLLLFRGGQLLKQAVLTEGDNDNDIYGDYTLADKTITLSQAPPAGTILTATYKLDTASSGGGGGGGGGSDADLDEIRAMITELQEETIRLDDTQQTQGRQLATQAEQLAGKVDKQLKTDSQDEYKVLSDNNYTDSEKSKLETLANYDDTAVVNRISTLESSQQTQDQTIATKAAQTDLDTLSQTVAGKQNQLAAGANITLAPSQAGTVEIAATDTVYDDTQVRGLIATNTTNITGLTSAMADKVDKETGKGLSTEDYTTAEKTKLASLSNYDDTAITNRVEVLESSQQTQDQTIATKASQTDLDVLSQTVTGKQNQLVAGSNIILTPSGEQTIISANGGGGGGGGADILEVQVFS